MEGYVCNIPIPLVEPSLASLVKSTSSATRLRQSGGSSSGICATVDEVSRSSGIQLARGGGYCRARSGSYAECIYELLRLASDNLFPCFTLISKVDTRPIMPIVAKTMKARR